MKTLITVFDPDLKRMAFRHGLKKLQKFSEVHWKVYFKSVISRGMEN